MLLSAVSVLVVAQSSSEIPEGLMNNAVLFPFIQSHLQKNKLESSISAVRVSSAKYSTAVAVSAFR
jgi:hypothetical protein